MVSANQKGYLSRSYSSPFEHSKSSKAAFPSTMTTSKLNRSTLKDLDNKRNEGEETSKQLVKPSTSHPKMGEVSKNISSSPTSREKLIPERNGTSSKK